MNNSYTVFISHSAKDIVVVRQYAAELQRYGIIPIVAQDYRPNKSPIKITEKIAELITNSDCIIAFLTKNAVKTNWVQAEIGFSYNKKTIIPLVEKGVKPTQLTFLEGTESINYDSSNPINSMAQLNSWLQNFQNQKTIESQNQNENYNKPEHIVKSHNQAISIQYQDNTNNIIAIVGITAITILVLYAIYKISKD
jgi:MTH538 TIR-like domain (DUF1863).